MLTSWWQAFDKLKLAFDWNHDLSGRNKLLSYGWGVFIWRDPNRSGTHNFDGKRGRASDSPGNRVISHLINRTVSQRNILCDCNKLHVANSCVIGEGQWKWFDLKRSLNVTGLHTSNPPWRVSFVHIEESLFSHNFKISHKDIVTFRQLKMKQMWDTPFRFICLFWNGFICS